MTPMMNPMRMDPKKTTTKFNNPDENDASS